MDAAPTDTQRQGRKIAVILDGARDIFLRDGYAGASVDDIARGAGVSKATLYSYFPDKRHLFSEVARHECQRQARAAEMTADLNGPPDRVLAHVGAHMLRFFLSDFGIAMFRMAVAETERFPELGRKFYDSGPAQAHASLAGYFAQAQARGEMAPIADPELAAAQFTELCKAWLLPRVLMGVHGPVTDADIDRVIRGAVTTFLARYGMPRPPA
jgi:AcrR family transcriptional regulator